MVAGGRVLDTLEVTVSTMMNDVGEVPTETATNRLLTDGVEAAAVDSGVMSSVDGPWRGSRGSRHVLGDGLRLPASEVLTHRVPSGSGPPSTSASQVASPSCPPGSSEVERH